MAAPTRVCAPHTSLLSAGAMHSVTGTRCRRRGETSKLTMQYRMEQSICELVNRAFPGGVVLETAPERLRVPRPGWQQHGSVVLVDTSFMNPVSRSASGGSVETPVHVDVVARMWHAVRASAGDTGPSVAIVTPYRAQCDALASARIDLADISTAHGWQGDEADVVMLSLDECSHDTMHFLGAKGIGRHEGERLIYVGATRPKHQLVVLGPVTHLLNVGSDATRSFLREVAQAGEVITPEGFYST
jgi:superfamily I DNA and/or RNA helicase